MSNAPVTRRTVLRGFGAALALPWLESLAGASAKAGPPNRLAVVYVPNGKNMVDWTPKAEGKLGDLPAILKPLEPFKNDFSVLTGLTADKARANGDGGGDHARAMSAFLTGAQPRKTDGTDIRAGVSADQVAAGRVGERTRLASLELGIDAGAMAGNCDSGYSCVYSCSLSWRSATQPLPREVNPKLVFERMFGNGPDSERQARAKSRRSLLDFVRHEGKAVESNLGTSDRRKLDEYFSAVRDIEVRMDRADKLPPVNPGGFTKPQGAPGDYESHIRMMMDLMVLAFQTDVTRVITLPLANESDNKSYSFIGVREGHHDLSHHGNDDHKKQKIRQINEFHTRQLAYLFGKLKGVREGNGTLLDHVMLTYGSANSDGNAHNHDDLPVLLAGGGCGSLKPGRHVRYAAETPLNNLWLALLDRMDAGVERLGDSTGALAGV